MDLEAIQYYKALEAEIEAELKAQDPVHQRFKIVRFVSKSKGRGRRRRNPVEVELIHDMHNFGRYNSISKFQFDGIATEVLPMIHKADVEQEFRRRLGVVY